MSVSISASAVIGVSIDVSDAMFEMELAYTCKHNLPIEEETKFCAKCGAPVVIINESTLPQFGDMYEFEEHIEKELKKLGDNWIIAKTHPEDSDSAFCVGVGAEVSEYGKHHEQVEMPDLGAVRADLKTLLTPFGLYDESTFGLHMVFYYG